jgi:RNA polymerase sigma-70 factor (ECF subfamily)
MDISLIYKEYFHQMYFISKDLVQDRQDAEDIVSEVFLKLIKYEKPEDIKDIRLFLFRLTRNKSIDFLRSRSRYEKRLTYYIEFDHDDNFDNYDLKTRIIEEFAKSLKGTDKSLFELSFVYQMKNSEVCDVLHMKNQSVRNAKHRMITELRRLLTLSKLKNWIGK